MKTMFLSMLVSFVLARKFRGRKYAILILAVIVLVSFFSAFGWIARRQRTDWTFKTAQYYTFHPVPLSFPFYASIFYSWTVLPGPIDESMFTYQINFLTFEITRATTYYPSPFTLWSAFVYYSLFLSVNIVGTFVGYWIGKLAILERFFQKET